MASMFHNRLGEAVVKKSHGPLKRRLHTTGHYFADLLDKHVRFIVCSFIALSLFLAYTHKPARIVARGLLTFEMSQAPAAMINNMGMPVQNTMRERQLQYLRSYEFLRQAAVILTSNEAYKEAAKGLKLIKTRQRIRLPWSRPVKTDELNLTIERLKSVMTVAENGDSNVQFEVEGVTRRFSLILADAVTKIATELINQSQVQNLSNSLRNISEQMTSLNADIDGLNQAIVKFKRDHKLLSTQTLPDDLRNSISNLNKSMLESQIQLQENDFLFKEISEKAEISRLKVLATQGVGYHDQILESKLQELTEQRSGLLAKIQGLKEIIAKENLRFQFVAEGEEKISTIKSQIKVKMEQLNQLEQRFKQVASNMSDLKHSIHGLGESFIVETRNGMNLSMKLLIANSFLFFIVCVGVFYFYEIFPVISYREPLISQMEAVSVPWLKKQFLFGVANSNKALRNEARHLSAQQILKRLPGPGLYQILSQDKGDGRTYVTATLAAELVRRQKSVCILDMSGRSNYGGVEGEVKVVKDPQHIAQFLENPKDSRLITGDADWVLIDTQALSREMTHLLVSPHMDGIIFIGNYLQTNMESFVDWQQKIEHIAGKKAFFILNQTDLKEDLPFLLNAPGAHKEVAINQKVS